MTFVGSCPGFGRDFFCDLAGACGFGYKAVTTDIPGEST
jgi:hypothetical protein